MPFLSAPGVRPLPIRRSIPQAPKRLVSPGGVERHVLVMSLVISMICFGALLRLSSRESKASEPPLRIVTEDDTIEIPVPARIVARGEKIGDVPIALVQWPKSRVSPEYVLALEGVRSSVAQTTLPKLLPIPLSALSSGPIEHNHVAEAIPAGMRAITVRVDAESAVEGWAQSGSFVDVILVRKGGGEELETKVIAENVRILSAGRSAEPQAAEQSAPTPPSTVTLLTSQEDALRIKGAANLGRLTFALRGHGDQAPTTSVELTEHSLLGGAKTLIPARHEFRGVARGPDGQNYVLEDGSRWVEASASIAAPHLGGSSKISGDVP